MPCPTTHRLFRDAASCSRPRWPGPSAWPHRTLCLPTCLRVPHRAGANDRLQIGLIGAGGMGMGNLANCAAHQDVVVTAICDVWKDRRDAACAQYPTAKPYADYRETLQQQDVDAVIIATPPHWHCLIAVEACAAGKDIYLQKPMSLHVAETLAIKQAVKRHERISQIGTQIHAGENYRRVVERIRSGQLGPISVVRTFNVMNQGPEGIGNPPATDPPADMDWDVWVGPARDVRLQPPDHAQRLRELLVHELQRRLDTRHGAAHCRPAVLGAGIGRAAAHELHGRTPHRAGRGRCAGRAGGGLAVPFADVHLVDERREQFRIRLRTRQRQPGGWASTSTASTARCMPITGCTKSCRKETASRMCSRRRNRCPRRPATNANGWIACARGSSRVAASTIMRRSTWPSTWRICRGALGRDIRWDPAADKIVERCGSHAAGSSAVPRSLAVPVSDYLTG